jgi:DNA polymerase (family 10)
MRREIALSTNALASIPRSSHNDSAMAPAANNERLAALFRSMAELLAAHRANPYRIRAYRRAADTLLGEAEDVAAIARRGALEELDGIGKELADKIQEFLATGSVRAYEELKTPLPDSVKDWAGLPGLTESLVAYLYFRLGIRSVTDLEQLVRSHLLRTLPGFTGSESALLEAIRELGADAKKPSAP